MEIGMTLALGAATAAGLGAAWGKEKALEMLGAAGFSNVRVETIEGDIMNYYYISGR